MHVISYAPTSGGELAGLAVREEASTVGVPGSAGSLPRVLHVDQTEMDSGL